MVCGARRLRTERGTTAHSVWHGLRNSTPGRAAIDLHPARFARGTAFAKTSASRVVWPCLCV